MAWTGAATTSIGSSVPSIEAGIAVASGQESQAGAGRAKMSVGVAVRASASTTSIIGAAWITGLRQIGRQRQADEAEGVGGQIVLGRRGRDRQGISQAFDPKSGVAVGMQDLGLGFGGLGDDRRGVVGRSPKARVAIGMDRGRRVERDRFDRRQHLAEGLILGEAKRLLDDGALVRGEPGGREVVLGRSVVERLGGRRRFGQLGRRSGAEPGGQGGLLGRRGGGPSLGFGEGGRREGAFRLDVGKRDHDALRLRPGVGSRDVGGDRLAFAREGLGADRLVVLGLAAFEGFGVGGAVEPHIGGQHDRLLPGWHRVSGTGRGRHRRPVVLVVGLDIGCGAMQQGVRRAGEAHLLGQGEGLQPRG